MTKLNNLFKEFLTNIEPDKKMVKYAQDAHKPVRDFLENDDEFGHCSRFTDAVMHATGHLQ